MARRFDQLFNSMSDVRSELKAEAKALFKNLYNTLRRTVRTNQQLANSLKVSLNLPPMAPVLLVELPALKETKRSLRDRIFTNITWTSTRRIREDFLAKAQNTLKQVIEDDKTALRSQIRQQSDAALDSFKSTLHQITTQFEYLPQYCRMLQTPFPCSDQELTRPFADCIAQLTAVNSSLDHIQAQLALYAKSSTG